MEDKVVHELYKMLSFFWLCASGHRKYIWKYIYSRACWGVWDCQVNFPVCAAAWSGIRSQDSWRKQCVFPYGDLGGDVSFPVLDDQSSSASLGQWLSFMCLDQPRLSFFSSEPWNFSNSFLKQQRLYSTASFTDLVLYVILGLNISSLKA